MKKARKYSVGIDEVGRGPIAGPVTVGAVILPASVEMADFIGLKDSKKLTEAQREVWYDYVIKNDIPWAVSSVSAKDIDKMGIAPAARRAAGAALAMLVKKHGVDPNTARVLLDKGLSVSPEWEQEQFIKGDERFPAIALASIMAKVTRDKYMTRLAKKFPQYGFEKHKGYGTLSHRRVLTVHGPCAYHRISFCATLLR